MRELRRQINKMAVGFILSGSDEEHMIDTAGDVNPDSFSSAPLSSPMEDVAENADDMERQIASMQISAERGEVDHSAPIGVDAEEDTLKEILFKPVEIPVSKLLPDVHAFPDIFTVKPRVLFAPVEIRHQSVITLAEVFPPYWSGPLFSGNAFADVFASDTFPSSFPQAGNAADSYGGFGTYGVPENTGETQDVCMGLADSSSEADVDDAMDFDTEDDITTFKSSIHGLRSHSIFGSAHPAPLPHQLAATTSAFGSSAPGHTNQTCTSQQSGFAAFATSSGNAFSAYSQSAPGNNYLSRAGSQSGFGAFANGSNGNGFSSYGQSALGYNYLSSAGLQTGFGQSAGYNPTTYDNYPGSPMPIDEPMSWGHSSSHAHQADEEMGSPMLVDEDLIPFDSYQSANQVDSNEESPMLIDLDLVPSASPDTPDSDTPSGSSKEQPAPSTPDVPLVPAPSKLESIMKLDPESRAGRALRSLKRQSFPSTPLFESYDGPVTEGAVRTLTEWVYDITGPSEFAAPESELAKLRLVMPLYSKKVIDALSTRLRGYRPGRQTVKALEVVYWLEEDAASMRALIRNCESGSVVAAREIATRITMNLDKTAPIKGYTPTSRAEIRSASVATSQAGGVPNPRPDSETDRDAQGQGKAAKRRMEVQGRR
ncbi:hypothetical protein CC85DRAFT_312876 [Cutaneotrichosporon oleaginosum]|uniref:Uncharacterized protein n=1 Tax=Cutaneotrichosporon oleaginosum TaxID=879819 RepID=A0A0J0XJJ9_9TREE|nr:uncharacterized protein CC85DRAFT_312876 [Cutaneotrichosporon oleaginosum]KLT41231.1 hypothetical protein CC85DRAFT_312876 [Cutaneotrichosporon oleaginosum]TXT05494.1 hypothetical protein COLE_06814 [Cutaneotrichosporon oleaginosum]